MRVGCTVLQRTGCYGSALDGITSTGIHSHVYWNEHYIESWRSSPLSSTVTISSTKRVRMYLSYESRGATLNRASASYRQTGETSPETFSVGH